MGVVVALKDFNPEEHRDDHGRWTSGGASHAARDVLGSAGEASRLTDEQHAQMTKAINDAKDRDPDLFSAKEGVQSVDFASGGGAIVRDLKKWSAVNAFTPGKGSTIVINDYVPHDRSSSGWFEHATPATRTPYGTVTHELGHAFFYRHGHVSKEQSRAMCDLTNPAVHVKIYVWRSPFSNWPTSSATKAMRTSSSRTCAGATSRSARTVALSVRTS